LQLQFFPNPGDRTLQKLGDDYLCECDVPTHGLGWTSNHPSVKWRGIFEANVSHRQGLNQRFCVLPLERKWAAQQWAKRWSKAFWRRLGPQQYKQTLFGGSLEQVILNSLKKSMPRMGPATAACKNLALNSLP
jgi:hypothetical protein